MKATQKSSATATLSMPPASSIAALDRSTDEALASLSIIVVDSPEAFDFASKALQSVVLARKTIVDFFAETKATASRLHKLICSQEKTCLSKVEPYEISLRSKLNSWAARVEDLRRKEQARVDAANAKKLAAFEAKQEAAASLGKAPPPPPVLRVAELASASSDSTHIRKTQAYEILDFSLLPDAYKLENSRELQAAANAHLEVPGVRFFETTSVVVRA